MKVTKKNTRYNLLNDLTRTSKLLFCVACHKKETWKQQHHHAFTGQNKWHKPNDECCPNERNLLSSGCRCLSGMSLWLLWFSRVVHGTCKVSAVHEVATLRANKCTVSTTATTYSRQATIKTVPGGWDSVAGIATCYELDGPGLDFSSPSRLAKQRT